jgi:putative transposase
MPRIARVVALNLPHHITQRGNYGQTVFYGDADITYYLALLREYSFREKVSFLAYCLMPNHVHFIGIPANENSLSRTFNAVHMKYARYINQKNKVRGHLWQGRYFSCVLDQRHVCAAARYIERNPVRARLADAPCAWKWSSAAYHCGSAQESAVPLEELSAYTDVDQAAWRCFIEEEDTNTEIADLRARTLTGRPHGDAQFIEQIEHQSGRKLTTPKMGRPLKVQKKW